MKELNINNCVVVISVIWLIIAWLLQYNLGNSPCSLQQISSGIIEGKNTCIFRCLFEMFRHSHLLIKRTKILFVFPIIELQIVLKRQAGGLTDKGLDTCIFVWGKHGLVYAVRHEGIDHLDYYWQSWPSGTTNSTTFWLRNNYIVSTQQFLYVAVLYLDKKELIKWAC